jgi:hypothetical protein
MDAVNLRGQIIVTMTPDEAAELGAAAFAGMRATPDCKKKAVEEMSRYLTAAGHGWSGHACLDDKWGNYGE